MSETTAAPRLFGTDGIRAAFGEPPLVRETVTAIGVELAGELLATSEGGPAAPPLVVLGGDTRESTPAICRWLAEGLAFGGAVVRHAGVVPTPGVAFLARHVGAAAGVSVSASHNPYPDNGIKLIDSLGFKWSEAAERTLERRLAAAAPPVLNMTREELAAEPELREAYLRHLAGTVRNGGRADDADGGSRPVSGAADGGRPLRGLRVVADAGNGAASGYVTSLFEALGSEVELLGAEPDGRNVNAGCGSTAPEKMAARVAASGAHLGVAFDGDADRCIVADEQGAVRDGDAILYLWATALHRERRLPGARIVATSMSNLGLERALAREGIGVVRCDVGDRVVVDTMRRERVLLGGEQSGHVVRLDLASTGDGLLTALQTAWLVARAGRPLSELLAPLRRYPQILLNVRVRSKPDLMSLPRVAAAARAVEERLGVDGRLVLRYSGTEPLARIMIEGPDQETVEALAGELAEAIRAEVE